MEDKTEEVDWWTPWTDDERDIYGKTERKSSSYLLARVPLATVELAISTGTFLDQFLVIVLSLFSSIFLFSECNQGKEVASRLHDPTTRTYLTKTHQETKTSSRPVIINNRHTFDELTITSKVFYLEMKTRHCWSIMTIMTYYLVVGILSTLLAVTGSKESRNIQPNEILQSFGYTGSFQRYVVPENITNLIVDCYGAQGGAWKLAKSYAGLGGYISTQITVTPGQILYVYVGGKGSFETFGGYNGGGHARLGGGIDSCDTSGGGASDVRLFLNDIASRLIVAGGGGGAGTLSTGGAGGGIMGGSGTGLFGGHGGGIDNINERLRGTGIISQGIDSGYCGGAGGGGHHGGFGAHFGGGGGGSSYSVGPTLNDVQGVQVGHGKVDIRLITPLVNNNNNNNDVETTRKQDQIQRETEPSVGSKQRRALLATIAPTPRPTLLPTKVPTVKPTGL